MLESTENATLYERDFHLWALQQAAAIREHSWLDIDIPNLTEELDYLAAAQVNAMESQMRRLFWHLLKMIHQPERHTRSGDNSVADAIENLYDLFERSSSLRQKAIDEMPRAYNGAVRKAARETGIEPRIFASGDSLGRCFEVVVDLTKIPAGHDGQVESLIEPTLHAPAVGAKTN